MAQQLGPIEICCDAPPYPVVRACRRLGFRDPEDVAWHRLGAPADGPRPGTLQAVIAVLTFARPSWARCACGDDLPVLEPCAFARGDGHTEYYRIGQCHRCRTISWVEGWP